MKLDSTDFELLNLPCRFEQDLALLDVRRRELLSAVHPDRFASEDATARRVAMQWSIRVNEAYTRLRDPLKRAAYLCELNGVAVQAEDNTAMPVAFLTQQMEWREALDDANDSAAVRVVADDVVMHRKRAFLGLAATLDDARDFAAAGEQVKALMFLDRIADDIERRLMPARV